MRCDVTEEGVPTRDIAEAIGRADLPVFSDAPIAPPAAATKSTPMPMNSPISPSRVTRNALRAAAAADGGEGVVAVMPADHYISPASGFRNTLAKALSLASIEKAIEEIDWSVGRVLDALRAGGIDEKTLSP